MVASDPFSFKPSFCPVGSLYEAFLLATVNIIYPLASMWNRCSQAVPAFPGLRLNCDYEESSWDTFANRVSRSRAALPRTRVCVWLCVYWVREDTYMLLSVRETVSASLDMLCCSLSLALVAGAMA